ncbi:MAG TPA: tetratricopeptide repeat protein [Burkholderiales bacterium]|jgi:tetratricopeptide (TPR) repeat protein
MYDLNGLAISTRSDAARAAFDRTLKSYGGNRVDTSDHLGATLAADPQFALGHCVKGYLMMLMYNAAALPKVAQAEAVARSLPANPREQLHIEALAAWSAADLARALRLWEQILAAYPADVLALRLSHFNYFWTGQREEMRASAERVAPRWSDGAGSYPLMLSCLAFGREECGDYGGAEQAGRRAVELDPADGWGAHAVAHVFEMQGRQAEGIEWLAGLERHWSGINNFVHHLWWHRAMFHLQRRELDAVLELYDRRFRDLASPLVAKMPDLYIDIQNAASMLFRLERQGVDVGGRWAEIADKAEARIGDCLSAFTLPHWMMALAAAGRESAAARMLACVRANPGEVVSQIAAPVCEAVLAHRRGEHERVLKLVKPRLGELHRLGGSHAQQDVLLQMCLDSAVKAANDEAASAIRVRRYRN